MISGVIHEGDCLTDVLKDFKDKEEVIRFAIYCAKDVEHLMSDVGKTLLNTEGIRRILERGTIPYIEKKAEKRCGFCSAFSNTASSTISYAIFSCDYKTSTTYAANVVSYVSSAKGWEVSPRNKPRRIKSSNRYIYEYFQIAKNWEIVWKNPSKNLLAISESYEFDQIFFDLIQDEREMCDVIIPYNGVEYYLVVDQRFKGRSQEEVIDKVMRSSKKNIICKLVQNTLR